MQEKKLHPPYFSIIIPTYNRPELLQKAVASVQHQTFNSWEIIVVVDGFENGPNTNYQDVGFKEVRWLFLPQRSLQGKARNEGIKMAKGKYLCFLDDDDYFLEDHLEILFQEIQQQKEQIAVFRTDYKIKKEEEAFCVPSFDPKKEQAVEYLFKVKVNMLSMAFHRIICQEIQFPIEYPIAQDHFFLHYVFSQYPLIQINRCTAIYVRHGKNVTIKGVNRNSLKLKEQAYQILFNSDLAIAKLLTQKEKKAYLANIYFYGAKVVAVEGLLLDTQYFLFTALLKGGQWIKFIYYWMNLSFVSIWRKVVLRF